MWILVGRRMCRWLGINGITLWPVVVLHSRLAKQNAQLLRHERIHLRQQAELLVLPFYLLYLLDYFRLRLRGYSHWKAYRHNCFEQEAYAHDQEADYLHRRKPWAWRKYYWK